MKEVKIAVTHLEHDSYNTKKLIHPDTETLETLIFDIENNFHLRNPLGSRISLLVIN